MIPRVLLCVAIFASVASSAFFEEDEDVGHPDFMEPEMRAKWFKQKRNQCKNYKELVCSKKGKCPVENRRTKKTCGHSKDFVCCAKCENLEGYGCKPKSQCDPDGVKGSFYCPKHGQACCKLTEVKLNMKCEEPWQCTDENQFCNLETGKCECDEKSVLQKGKCVLACNTFGEYQGYKLIAYPGLVPREKAIAMCKYEGGRLPVIKDSAMSDAIGEVKIAASIPDSDSVWIGLAPSKMKYKYMWEDMSPLMVNEADGLATDGTSYTNFNTGRSYDNALGEDCYMTYGPAQQWEDIPCDGKGMVTTVCECDPKFMGA